MKEENKILKNKLENIHSEYEQVLELLQAHKMEKDKLEIEIIRLKTEKEKKNFDKDELNFNQASEFQIRQLQAEIKKFQDALQRSNLNTDNSNSTSDHLRESFKKYRKKERSFKKHFEKLDHRMRDQTASLSPTNNNLDQENLNIDISPTIKENKMISKRSKNLLFQPSFL